MGSGSSQPGIAIVFACADRFGREVVLREDTWYNHVLDQHPELTNRQTAAEEAIRLAEQIRVDRFDTGRRCFYRRGLLPPPYQRDQLKVVVEFYPSDAGGVVRGEVVTAYLVSSPDRREQREW